MNAIPALATLSRGYHRYDEPITEEYVKRRLEEAGRTLYCLPGVGCRPTGFKSCNPDILRALSEMVNFEGHERKPQATQREISRMDEAYSWVEYIPYQRGSYHGGAVIRRIVLLRSFTHWDTGRYIYSWNRLSRIFGADRKSIKDWYSKGISIITKSLLK